MDRKNDRPIGRWTYCAVVLGAALGMFAGLTPSFHAAGGIFARAVGGEFGWGRSMASLSYSASMMGLTVGSPLVGMLMDRFGVRRVVASLGVAYGFAVICMALQNGDKMLWVGLSALVGIFGAAVSVVGYLAVLPQWFDRRLGLALALAMCGLGIGTTLMPSLAQMLVSEFGWRAAYVALGAGSIPLTLLACLLIRERRRAPRGLRRVDVEPADGLSLVQAAKTYRLWAIWLIFLVGSSCTLALVPHLPTMLADRGFSPADAARGASMLGTGLLAGRLLTGLMLDRMHAPFVTCVFFVSGAIGLLMLRGSHELPTLMMAAALVGLTIGAEGDLISYLVRSYFGLRSFGTLYGICFCGYGLGAVVGPVAIGRYFDRHGNYDLPLLILPCILLVACVLTLTLGRYRRAGQPATGEVASSLSKA
ncbi:MFS transporter [Burkholderia sp. JPY481]|uniref:MFS transporter n=1 Tax=unclassified Paraburkholderia TaxID=2615204 RepID=UPI00318186A2